MATTQTQTAAAEVLKLKEETQLEGESLTQLAIRRISRDYLTMIAMAIVFTLAVLSLGAPIITDVLDVSYRQTQPDNRYAPLGAEGHPLGTDKLGRDHLARLLYGGQVSLSIALSAALASTIIGISIGLFTGYFQGTKIGIVDDIIMWFITTLNSVPDLALLILLASVLAPTVKTLIFVLTVLSWSGTMRLVRGETLSHRGREYVVGAEAVGASSMRIMFVHILPNVFSVMIISLALAIGGFILSEAALSFLGLGVRPPTPSWGNMLNDAQVSFRQAPHLSIIPGALISVTVLCLFIIGDGLRDAFDPRAAKRT